VAETQKHDTERIFARDAVKMALSMEGRCLEFYRDAAKRNQDLAGREVFERMAQEEENHIADLNTKLEEIVRQEKDLEHASIFLHFDPCELEALIPDLAKFERSGEFRMDAKASTELALSLNRSLAEFFKKYADKFSETQGKQILLNFANQESAHSDLLRQRMEGMLSVSSAV
jgi:rubrerythrin